MRPTPINYHSKQPSKAAFEPVPAQQAPLTTVEQEYSSYPMLAMIKSCKLRWFLSHPYPSYSTAKNQQGGGGGDKSSQKGAPFLVFVASKGIHVFHWTDDDLVDHMYEL